MLVYTGRSVVGKVIGEGANYPELFGSVVGSPGVTLLGLLLFSLINILVISMGVQNGIEKSEQIHDAAFVYLFYHIGCTCFDT